MDIDNRLMIIKGLVPGAAGGLLAINRLDRRAKKIDLWTDEEIKDTAKKTKEDLDKKKTESNTQKTDEEKKAVSKPVKDQDNKPADVKEEKAKDDPKIDKKTEKK